MFIARRQKGLRIQGANENFLKRVTIDVPDELRDALPGMGVRLALRHSTGFYQGITPASVSIYLVPRNGSATQDRTLVETVILSHDGPVGFDGERKFVMGYEAQLGPLAQVWKQHPPAREVARALPDYELKEILTDYIARTQATAQSE
jgi:hypothetical protein